MNLFRQNFTEAEKNYIEIIRKLEGQLEDQQALISELIIQNTELKSKLASYELHNLDIKPIIKTGSNVKE